MAGRPVGANGRRRPVVVATRLDAVEVAAVDAARGSLSRAEWLRWVVLRAVREKKV